VKRLALALLAAATTAQAAPPAAPAAHAAPPSAATSFARSGISDWTKPPAPQAEPTFKPPVPRRLVLKNGMTVLVVENHALPIVAMQLVVPGAGAADDPAKKGGLAAFTADMLDEGAGGLSAIQIADETDRLGASIGVGAGTDDAELEAQTLTKTLDPTLDLITKIITAPAFDQKEFERVRGDRLTSLELRRDRPREVAQLVLDAALYGLTSTYGHPAGGQKDEFKDLTLADLQSFYKAHWNPAVMTLVVAGDVEPGALKAKLDAGLGAWKPTGARRPSPPHATPAKITSRLQLVDRPGAEQSDVRIGLVGPDRKDRRYYAFEVMTSTLGGGFTSRLVQTLREKMGITYGAHAGMDWRRAPGPFVISTAIVTGATGQGIAKTLEILDDLATHDLSTDELEKSKQNLIRALPAEFETNASTAATFADLALLGLPIDFYAHYADGIRKVTARDVKAAAATLTPPKKMVISIVGDLSKIRGDLDKLGLGAPAMHDPDGMPLK
jgi:zinc protease